MEISPTTKSSASKDTLGKAKRARKAKARTKPQPEKVPMRPYSVITTRTAWPSRASALARESFMVATHLEDPLEFCFRCNSKYDYIHECGSCLNCCVCAYCTKCAAIMKVNPCMCCSGCPTCCKCVACGNCGNIVSEALCGSCGACTKCCTVKTTMEHVVYTRAQTDLTTYVGQPHNLLPSTRLLSAEIETCGNIESAKELNLTLHKWRCSVVMDGSLPGSGFEINTHPASGDQFVAMAWDIYSAFKSCRAWWDYHAGCHIHVDARDYGYTDVAKLLKVYHRLEDAFYQLIPRERRESHYCQRCAGTYMAEIKKAEVGKAERNERLQMLQYRSHILNALYGVSNPDKYFIKTAKLSKGTDRRYRGLNLHSWVHRGTVEFRFVGFQSTATDLINFAALLTSLLDICKSNPAFEIPAEAKQPLLYIAPTQAVKDWVIERTRFYNTLTEKHCVRL